MLVPGQVPFPENPTCKQCLGRPCQRLFTGAITPGKTVFVHSRDFLALPCYAPPLSKKESDTDSAAALTDDIVTTQTKVEISNPRWKPISEAEAGGDPEIPLLGDTVQLLADVKNYPDGAPVSFDIYDVTDTPPLRIATVNTSNKAGTATAEWKVEDPQKRGEKLKLQFEAGAKSKYTEKADLPWQNKIKCNFVEVPDVLFNHNSAVPCLDEGEILVGAITTALEFAKNNSDKEVVLYGHTDSSGQTQYNMELSELRCKSIKALLDNKKEDFVSVCNGKFAVEDYQTILTTLTKKYTWDCDPGAVNNQPGPKTEAALKCFQTDFNLFYGQSIAEDGKIGKETWGAFFTVLQEIILGISGTQAEEQPPALTYGKGGKGICPCGEKYAEGAFAKVGRKSKKDRRVEIVFEDPAHPIEDTPYVDTVVMEPIEVKVENKGTIKNVTLNCTHREKYKGSTVKYLGIVPAPNDLVTMKASVSDATTKIQWKISGAENKELEGKVASLKVGSFSSQAANLIPALLNDAFLAIIPPKKIYIKAVDESQKAIKSILEVYPYNTNTQEVKIPTGLKKFIDWAEKINKILKDKFDTRLSFKFLEGKISLAVNWAEDQDCEKVYPAFELKGGFAPLIGIEWTTKIQLIGVMNLIPEKIRKYIADIAAFLTVAGTLELTVGIAKISYSRIAGKGTVGGAISVTVGLSAEIGNKKILALKGQLTSAIGAEATIQYKKLQNESTKNGFYLNAEGKFGALKGVASFELFDGVYARNAEIILLKEEKWPIAEDIPLFGSEKGAD